MLARDSLKFLNEDSTKIINLEWFLNYEHTFVIIDQNLS